MPYIFVEELPEGAEEADVVERSDYDSVVTERDEARSQRDDAIERADAAEADVVKQKEKYANTFLKKPSPKPDDKPYDKPFHFMDMFSE